MPKIDLRISTKILCVVGTLAALIAGLSGLAIYALSDLNRASSQALAMNEDAMAGLELSREVTALNRAEYRLVADLDPENVEAAVADIQRLRAAIKQRLAAANERAGPERAALLEVIGENLDAYGAESRATVTAAREHAGTASLSAGQAEVLAEARKSRGVAEDLQTAVAGYVDYTSGTAEEMVAAGRATYGNIRTAVLLTALIGGGLGVGAGLVVARRGIVAPLQGAIKDLRRLADGELDFEVRGSDRPDEIGDIARTMEVFQENARAVRRMQAEQDEAERKAEERRIEEMSAVASRFETEIEGVVDGVAAASTQMESTAQSLSSLAEEASRQATTVASASEQASTNIQTVASAAEQLSSSIREIGRQVTHSAELSRKAMAEASDATARIRGLNEAAERIGQVVELITDIADRTNLLALNATIEAARAGDAGQGFAVVAGEVKRLADQTAKATDQIAGQVREVQAETGATVTAIETVLGRIDAMTQAANAVASAVEEQDAATDEIARNVQEAATGAQEVTVTISGVQSAAGETGRGSGDVLETSKELAVQSDVLRTKVRSFIGTLRAA